MIKMYLVALNLVLAVPEYRKMTKIPEPQLLIRSTMAGCFWLKENGLRLPLPVRHHLGGRPRAGRHSQALVTPPDVQS